MTAGDIDVVGEDCVGEKLRVVLEERVRCDLAREAIGFQKTIREFCSRKCFAEYFL